MKPLDINKDFTKIVINLLGWGCAILLIMLSISAVDLKIKQLQKNIDYSAVKTVDYNNASCTIITLPNQLSESIFCTNK